MEASEMDLKRVLKNFNLLNLILLAAVVLFAYEFLFPEWNAQTDFVLPPAKKAVEEKGRSEAAKPQSLSPLEYVVIAEQNLFHPDRIIPPEKKAEVVLPKPEFILYGTLISPEVSLAYMEDKKAPVTTPGRGQRQSTLKKGESLSGFTLKEIMADKVVMARGEETMTVSLEDPKTPKTRHTPETAYKTPVPGIPGMPAAPVTQITGPGPTPTTIPMPSGPGAVPSPGMKMPTMPASPGIGASPQPMTPGGISPTTPGSPAFPARRLRTMQPPKP
jgi:hypothetical protein